MRLDRFIANMTIYSRKDCKQLVREGRIKVDDCLVKNANLQIDPTVNLVSLDSLEVAYKPHIYYLINKPAGYVSSTDEKGEALVTDLLPKNVIDIYDPYPVGRLDKDTTGLLILTNDGDFTHRSLSPKSHVEKEYEATVQGIVDNEDIINFKEGIKLGDGTQCQESNLTILSIDETLQTCEISIVIHEGKFHQIKRMFKARGKKVLRLKRKRFGNLILPEHLSEGEFIELNRRELYHQVFSN